MLELDGSSQEQYFGTQRPSQAPAMAAVPSMIPGLSFSRGYVIHRLPHRLYFKGSWRE